MKATHLGILQNKAKMFIKNTPLTSLLSAQIWKKIAFLTDKKLRAWNFLRQEI
jgi:hypothetical protein